MTCTYWRNREMLMDLLMVFTSLIAFFIVFLMVWNLFES